MSTNRLEMSFTLSTIAKTCCVVSLHESDVTLFFFRRVVGVLQFSVGRLGHSHLPRTISWPPRYLKTGMSIATLPFTKALRALAAPKEFD